MSVAKQSIVFVIGVVALVFFSFAPRVNAVGLEGDAMCNPVIPSCPCGTVPGPKGCTGGANKFMCPPGVCIDNTSGFSTPGTCIAPNKCKALSTSGPDGFGLDIVKQMLGSLMQKLMQGSKGGGGGESGAGTGALGDQGKTGCTSYYRVTTPSTDPCAYYVAPVSEALIGTGSEGSNPKSVFDQLNALTNTNINDNTNTGTDTNLSTVFSKVENRIVSASSSTSTAGTQAPGRIAMPSGITGDMRVFQTGVTILAGSVDEKGNSATAGFFGSDTMNGQPVGNIVTLCKSRPWSGNLLAYALPPNFFDSLCVMRGYSVGTPPATPPAVIVVKTIATSSPATTTVPVLPPKVDIWAVPETVPLGSRASIFWVSQGVKNCTVTTPDGTFSETTLNGAASTIALTKATIFTISCTAPDGKPATRSVTVNLST